MERKKILILSTTIFLISINTLPIFSENHDEGEIIIPDGFTLSADIIGEQTLVSIKKEFSIDTTDIDSMINQIIENFALTNEQIDLMLVTEEKDMKLDEKLTVSINSRGCISKINIVKTFIVDSKNRDDVIKSVIEEIQLSNRQIKNSLDFELDNVEIIVRVQSGKARVQIDYCDEISRFVVSSSDETKIISEINAKTGLREYKIPLIWDFITDIQTPEKKPLTLEEQKEVALKYGEDVFSNAEKQMEKAEGAQKMASEGGEVPASLTGGGGCLIATATFGSELSPQVQMLREIRDDTVLSTSSGTAFMTAFNSFYYSFSPTVADLERQNPLFKETIKIAITPLLSTLSLLSYVDIDSEQEMLGYGIGIILLNVGIYFGIPTVLILRFRKNQIRNKKFLTRGFY